MKFTIFLIVPIFWHIKFLSASPLSENGGVPTVSQVTPYPDAQKQVVNINNVSPEVTNLLRKFNVDFDQINAQRQRLQQNRTIDRAYYEVMPYSASSKEYVIKRQS